MVTALGRYCAYKVFVTGPAPNSDGRLVPSATVVPPAGLVAQPAKTSPAGGVGVGSDAAPEATVGAKTCTGDGGVPAAPFRSKSRV